MKRDLFEIAASLTRTGISFVLATVVRRDGLSSAHQGDMAIVTADGTFHGWVGGGCTRPTVEREAALALAERKPRLISLSPDPERDPRPGLLALPMTCQSGGTVEVYLDPVIAAPRLVLFGRSPINTALAAIARAIGYRVDVADPDARPDEVPAADRVFIALDAPELAGRDAWVVVATMGEFDEDAVIAALALDPAYLGVVASRRRFALLRDALVARRDRGARSDRQPGGPRSRRPRGRRRGGQHPRADHRPTKRRGDRRREHRGAGATAACRATRARGARAGGLRAGGSARSRDRSGVSDDGRGRHRAPRRHLGPADLVLLLCGLQVEVSRGPGEVRARRCLGSGAMTSPLNGSARCRSR